jgi:serine/threonine-protein kinase
MGDQPIEPKTGAAGGQASDRPPSGAVPSASAVSKSAPPIGAPVGEPRVSETPPPVPSGGTHAEDPLVGTVLLDRVRIERPIARGGMGKVYYGEQVRMKRPCAIKILDPRMGAGGDIAEFTRRFLLEASIAAKLTHPNVVTIYDYGEIPDGSCFIAMEFLEGKSLSDELKAVGRISPDRAIHIVRQVARALREAHGLGVVHRDMKPGNVYLVRRDDDDDVAKVLDFGLVKENTPEGGQDHTQFGQIMGSPRYMAPEQVQGKHVDARTDIYSVGAMFYAMLTGRPPFDKSSDLAILMAQVSEAPMPISQAAPDVMLPAGLEAVVMRCLAKDPADRYGSMEDLIAALKLRPDGWATASDSGSMSAPRLVPPVIAVQAEPPPRSRLPWIMAGLVVAVGVVVAALMLREGPAPAVAAAAPSVAPPPPVSAPPPPAPPPAPVATASLHVDTDPPGVKVKEEGEVMCEATPCDIVYTGAQADPTYEHLLVFLKADYKLERKLVKISASPFSVKMSRAR